MNTEDQYRATLDYLYAQLPVFEQTGPGAYKPGLERVSQLLDQLEHPEHHFTSLHIAGTNGKGSSSHMLAAILQAAGYKTGLFTSPHLKDFTERIRVNGIPVSKEYVIEFTELSKHRFTELKPTFFEVTTAMALDYFAKEQVDVAVIEVGLGGRLDSTNIIQPIVSLITNISFDHQSLLGNTLDAIAAEKAGIIKKQTPVVISETHDITQKVFIEKAAKEEAPITFADECYQIELVGFKQGEMIVNVYGEKQPYLMNLHCGLSGEYQMKNLCGVLTVVQLLQSSFTIREEHIRQGIQDVSALTGLKGRWQVVQQHPLVICDTGHNEAGLRYIARQLSSLSYQKLIIVFGAAQDKDSEKILSLLPAEAWYIFCKPNIPRARSAEELLNLAQTQGKKGEWISSVSEACGKALSLAGTDDVIFIGGSTFVVAEVPFI